MYFHAFNTYLALAGVTQLAGVLSRKPKALRFNYWSGHRPTRLQIRFGAQSGIQEAADQCFSPSFSLLLKSIINMSSGED